MATLAAGTNGLDMTTFTFLPFSAGTVVSHDATSFVVDYGNGIVDTYSGNGFDDYDASNIPEQGVITGFMRTSSGTPVVTITGCLIFPVDYTFVVTTSPQGIFPFLLTLGDSLIGSGQSDHLVGYAGGDTLRGGAGNDVLDGGDDTFSLDVADFSDATSGITVNLGLTGAQAIGGGLGSDTLIDIGGVIGSNFADSLTGTSGDNSFEARGGNDSITGGAGIDQLIYRNASSGITLNLSVTTAQTVSASEGSDTIVGIENVVGSAFNDTITGDTAANFLEGLDGNDILNAGSNNDTLRGGGGNDIFNGDIGNDTVNYQNAMGGVSVDLSLSTAQVVGGGEGSDTITGVENVTGSGYNDTLRGSNVANIIDGGFGNDTLIGGGGDDTLNGGGGFDIVNYANATDSIEIDLRKSVQDTPGNSGEGFDTFISIEGVRGSNNFFNLLIGNNEDNQLLGGTNQDSLMGGGGNDVLDGGAGVDTARYIESATGVTVDLTAGTASGEGNDTLISIEQVFGSSHDDHVTGNSSDNIFDAIQGDDTFEGGAGNDVFWGGLGTDTISYEHASSGVSVDLSNTADYSPGAGLGMDRILDVENVIGSAFNDVLRNSNMQNVLSGMGGDDLLHAAHSGVDFDTYDGGSGSDTVDYGASSNTGVNVDLTLDGIEQHVGNGRFHTLISMESVLGSTFVDTLLGNGANNVLNGRAGDDVLEGGAGDDQLIGGTNIDTARYAGATGAVTVNLAIFGAQAVGGGMGSDTLSELENLSGSAFGDTLIGTDGVNVLSGGEGGDTLAAAGGADTLNGEGGNDALFGGLGIDNMYGGEGDDLVYLADSDGILEGGNGYDQVIVLTTNAVNVTIETGVEYVAGNNGADILSAAGTTTAITIGGAGGNDTLTGGAGGDILAGMDGTDIINGGGGDDLIYILGNDDVIQGDSGYDQAIILDTNGVSITIEATTEYCAGNSGNDTIDASALSTVVTLGGAGGDDVVRGGSGADTLSGSFGIDTLFGNGGGDVIFGGDDVDAIYGGAGNDHLFGGGGSDVFFIETNSGVDVISDFAKDADVFDFTLHATVTGYGDFSISSLGGDAIVDFAGGQLYIVGAGGTLDPGDFVFG